MTNLPVSGSFSVTATFGQTGKYWKAGHKGVDIVADHRTVYATCNGRVRVVAYDAAGWGQYVSVGDENGNRHLFCHLVKGSVKVQPGQAVTRTTVIGTMGSSGNSTGVHLHYQINDGSNTPTDPTKHLGIPNRIGTYNANDYAIKEDGMTFKDEQKISLWARAAVDKVANAGLMVGDENGKFNPQMFLTREEAAVILERLLAKMK